ncbi:hypothetical protein [Streptomyces longisporoflavus]|uniref:Uncharacterized protein n=1 Tax=Streptomyces longisporoflavus TaxID=28044 RepID=A0ABW7QNS7_9ACTN
MSVLTVGLAAIVRSSAGTITVLFVPLLIVPTIPRSTPSRLPASLTPATAILGRRYA